MAEFLGIPYTSVALAALIPALLYFASVFFQVHLAARRQGLEGLSEAEIVPFRTIVVFSYRAIPLLVLIYLIFVQRYSPVYAAFWAIGAAVLVGLVFGRELRRIAAFVEALRDAALAMLPVTIACAAAGVVVGMLMLTGLGFRLSSIMV